MQKVVYRTMRDRGKQMDHHVYPRPHDQQTVSLRRWDWDKEKAKCSIPAIQSGDIAALEE